MRCYLKLSIVLVASCLTLPSVAAGKGFEMGAVPKGVDPGEVLIGELSCVNCHSADEAVVKRLNSHRGPVLDDAGKRYTPQYLKAYISDPHTVRPHTRMGDIFHSSDAVAKEKTVDMLVQYLVSQGGPIDQSPVGVNSSLVGVGEQLFHTVGCVACHTPKAAAELFKPEGKKPAGYTPKKGNKYTAMRTTVPVLKATLLDPLKHHPTGRMPDMKLSPEEAEALAVYILRDQIDTKGSAPARPGIKVAYYESQFDGNEPKWDQLKPKYTDVVKDFNIAKRDRNDHFAFRWEGAIRAEKAGKYQFWTKSDDGSWVWINGKLVVNNGGIHGAVQKSGVIDLPAGDHQIAVAFYEAAGGEELTVWWQPPGEKRTKIPGNVLFHYPDAEMKPTGQIDFKFDPQKARMGKMMFSMLRCANCHTPGQAQNIPSFGRTRPVPKLAELNLDNPSGCIGDNIRRGLPKFNISDEQRAMIKKTLKNVGKLGEALSPALAVNKTLVQFGCLKCHNRNDVGGPSEKIDAFFNTHGVVDLGDEGRIPPTLNTVGAKLTTKALEGVLFKGEEVRPYMASRMPQFGKANIGHLVEDLAKADHAVAEKEVPFNKLAVKDGHKLVGVRGLGCINCHTFNGQKSLGVPSIDLGTMATRLRPAWLKQFLRNPQAVNKMTRMPPFWLNDTVAFKDVAGGTVDGQIEAIYQYLSLGKSMPAPIGLASKANGTELKPGGSPIVFRTFMTDMSPRAIAVGYPELVHAAFDGNVVRLGKFWRGRFFDAGGTWNGRAGGFSGPLGTDVIDLPAGPAFAVLADGQSTPWPKVDKSSRNVGGKMKGYKLNGEGRPIFMYELKGVKIEEQPVPSLRKGGADMVRVFKLQAKEEVKNLYLIAGSGNAITKAGDVYEVDGNVRLTLPQGVEPILRKVDGKAELLIPVQFKKDGNGYAAGYKITVAW